MTQCIELFIDRIHTFIKDIYRLNLLSISLVVFTILILLCNNCLIVDPDLPWHLIAAKEYLLQGTIKISDQYSFNHTLASWYNHQWAASLIFYTADRFLGEVGLFILKIALAIFTSFFIIKTHDLTQKPTIKDSCWIYFCLFQSLYIWTSNVRGRIFPYLFFAITLFLIEKYRVKGDKKSLAYIPLVTLLGINFHAEFVHSFLPLLILIFFPSKNGRQLPILITFFSALATLINPWGLELYTNYLIPAMLRAGSGSHIADWNSSSLSIGLLLKITLLIAILKGRWKEKTPYELTLILICGCSAIAYDRTSALFFFCIAIWGSRDFQVLLDYIDKYYCGFKHKFIRSLNLGILMLPIISIFALFNDPPSINGLSIFNWSASPISAIEWLKTNRSPGNILIHFNQGSYVLQKLGPMFKVSIDSRYDEIYPDESVQLALQALELDGKNARLQLMPDYILIEDARAALLSNTLKDEGFIPVFSGQGFSIFDKG